jgi:Kef-type K+ transport system membrane component KefB
MADLDLHGTLTLGLVTLGLLLVAALLGGRLAEYLRLPKVTAYLLAGMLVGPGILHCVREEHLHLLEPLTSLAISLVLFNLGCHFPMARVRRILRRVLRLSLGELIATFLLVLVGLSLLGPLVGARWEIALLLAALAVATAPATTILVLKENESEGPVTEYASSLVALNNLAAIVLFELFFLAIHFFGGQLSVPVSTEVRLLFQDLAGSVLLGVAGGLIVSFTYPQVTAGHRLVLLLGIITLLLGLCELGQMPYLLTFLAMGITVANSSDQTRQALAELDRLTGLLCVVFFVTHGAQLRPDALLTAGLIGVGYIVLRFSGKCFGLRLAATVGREERAVRTWLGPSMVAHAGIAIALSAIAVERTEAGDPALHRLFVDVHTVILGAAVVFEIVGPILIRLAVLRAGEVPLAHAIHHTSFGPLDQLQTMWNRLLIAAGRDPWAGRAREDLTVGELMRKNVVGLPQEADFHEVVAHIEHSHDNTYPVVNRRGELAGVIRYRELSNALFDPALNALVRAADVTTPAGWVLHPKESVLRAYELFQATKDDCLPVVTRNEPCRLVGLVRRRDVLRLLIRGQMDSQEN